MRRSITLLIVVVALMTVTGVGHAAPAGRTSTVTLTTADNGTSITVRRGDTVVVRLHGDRTGNVTWGWSEPESSAPDVLAKVSSGGGAGGDVFATFSAVAAGSADLSSWQTCRPTGEMACVAVAHPWNVHVTVTE